MILQNCQLKGCINKVEKLTHKYCCRSHQSKARHLKYGHDIEETRKIKICQNPKCNKSYKIKRKDRENTSKYCGAKCRAHMLGKKCIGRRPWSYGLTVETNEKLAEMARKVRVSMIKHLKEYNAKSFHNIGKYETQLLNEQEIKDNCKITRQYEIEKLGYILDGYCVETNTVYEVYEKRHFKNMKHDLQRQKEIEECLGCKFIIIQDKTH